MRYLLTMLLVFSSILASAQTTSYQGILYSSFNAEPVKKAIVIVQPSGERTISKDDGSFQIMTLKNDCYLTIAHPGYNGIARTLTGLHHTFDLEVKEKNILASISNLK